MNSTPTISVLMPVYNGERYLAAAVESILNQTYRDFEFIIVDDGSTDGSLKILQRYAAQDERIRLVSRPNTGYVAALNEMAGMVRGQFVARMDADDIALPQRFEVQLNYLLEHPQVVCVGSAYEVIDGKGRTLMIHHESGLDNANTQDQLLRGNVVIAHPTVMMRADVLRSLGGYDPAMMPAEDLNLWLRMGEAGELAVLPQVLLKYREHEGSVSTVHHDRQLQVMRRICEQAWDRRGIEGRFENTGWRQTDNTSRLRRAMWYGWDAWQRGDRRMAAEFGFKAVFSQPLKSDGWRLLACCALKRAPRQETVASSEGSSE